MLFSQLSWNVFDDRIGLPCSQSMLFFSLSFAIVGCNCWLVPHLSKLHETPYLIVVFRFWGSLGLKSIRIHLNFLSFSSLISQNEIETTFSKGPTAVETRWRIVGIASSGPCFCLVCQQYVETAWFEQVSDADILRQSIVRAQIPFELCKHILKRQSTISRHSKCWDICRYIRRLVVPKEEAEKNGNGVEGTRTGGTVMLIFITL